jgi:hypothetical protein
VTACQDTNFGAEELIRIEYAELVVAEYRELGCEKKTPCGSEVPVTEL